MLNAHQKDLIMKSSITPQQILENMDGLNEEIAESYDMELAQTEAGKDGTLKEVEAIEIPDVKEVLDNMFEVEDMDAKLEQEAKAAEAALRKKQEEAKAAAEAAAQEQSSKAEVEEELSPEEAQKRAIMELLSRIPNAPDEKTIDALKAKFGKNGVNVLALGEDDIYIFTYLRRKQWQHIQKIVQGAAESDTIGDAEEMLKEKVLQYTVLWPKGVGSVEFLYNSRAGVVDTLYQTILLNSYFLSPQQAMMLTSQL